MEDYPSTSVCLGCNSSIPQCSCGFPDVATVLAYYFRCKSCEFLYPVGTYKSETNTKPTRCNPCAQRHAAKKEKKEKKKKEKKPKHHKPPRDENEIDLLQHALNQLHT